LYDELNKGCVCRGKCCGWPSTSGEPAFKSESLTTKVWRILCMRLGSSLSGWMSSCPEVG